jgi:hypothetical protein
LEIPIGEESSLVIVNGKARGKFKISKGSLDNNDGIIRRFNKDEGVISILKDGARYVSEDGVAHNQQE